jgi:HEAT repeat protein
LVLEVMVEVQTPLARQLILTVADMQSPPIELRAEALSCLAFVDSPTNETLKYLRHYCGAPAVDMLISSALALGVISTRVLTSDEELSAQLVEFLKGKVESASDAQRRAAYLQALGNTRADQVLETLTSYANSPEPVVRAAAMEALGQFESSQAWDALRQAMQNDKDISLRQAAAGALAGQETEQLVPFFKQQARENSCSQVRALSLVYLTRYVDKDSSLKEFFQHVAASDPDEEIRQPALNLLQQRADESEKE